MAVPTLQDAIETAGSPMKLLWKPNSKTWQVPIVAPEYAGWRQEQAAWRDGVTLMDLSYHMWDTFIEGKDATRLLSAVSANDFSNFAYNQAKQFVPVNHQGKLITDGILLREDENKYVLSGVPASQTWVRYHGIKGGYDVNFVVDPDSSVRKDSDPKLFRYQIQGPLALAVVEKVFGGPLPKTKFFHSTPVSLKGIDFRAFRHGMAGQAGYEFIGNYADHEVIRDTFLNAGEEFGIVRTGGLAYFTNGIESGWVPTPTPAIYTAPELEDYRRFISLYSYEGQRGLHGSYFSENIEDYYLSPFELGYGKSIAFNHDFIGRAALEAGKDQVRRTKVTLALNLDDVHQYYGEDPGFVLSYARYAIEAAGKTVGMTFWTGFIDPVGTILALSLVDKEFATPGTEVTFVLGEHPGFGGVGEFKRLRATVHGSPFNEHARTAYRKN